jgi:hypothetical protein
LRILCDLRVEDFILSETAAQGEPAIAVTVINVF